MSYTIGIDPGARTGAIAILQGQECLAVDWLPFLQEGKSVYLHTEALTQFIGQHIPQGSDVVVYIERQQSMPKQGVSSTFKTGAAYGAIVTYFQALNYRVEIIEARQWKKQYGLIQKDKDSSRSKAMLRFPSVWLPLKKDHNKADALLIADFGLSM